MLHLIRYSKILFVWLRLHTVVRLFSGLFSQLYYLSLMSAWINAHRKAGKHDFPSRWDYQKRYPFYKQVLESEQISTTPIHYFEFGVASGASFKWFLEMNQHPDSRFMGFDTFTGLPEDFGVYKKGMFNANNEVPHINDARGSFHQGLFQQTLPAFLSTFENDKKKVIMLDADLYSATLFVLTSFAPLLKKGDIIFFDEFSVPTQEFKAFHEFQHAYPHIPLQLIDAANNFYFTAFKVV